MSNQLQITGAAKIRTIQGPVVANSGVITALNGDATQYVRGDGTLADFPTSTGGGSSVSYYLNTSVSQGTIGGVAYKQLSKVPIIGAGTDVSTSVNGYIASYITDANDPALLEVPAGNFNCEFYFSVNSDAHNPYVYAEVYKYDGTTFTLLGSNVSIPQYLSNGTTLSPYYFAIAVSTAVLTVTDRIAIRIYVNVDTRTVTLHTENNHLCQVVTTFSKGLISLNNLTRQNQFFATGTSGTDFAIVSSVATHTFNLPVASAANTGKLSSTDWSTFNNKIAGSGTINTIPKFTASTTIGNSNLSDNGNTLEYQGTGFKGLEINSTSNSTSLRLEAYSASTNADNGIKEIEMDGYYSSFNSYFGFNSSGADWEMTGYADTAANTTNRGTTTWQIPSLNGTYGYFDVRSYHSATPIIRAFASNNVVIGGSTNNSFKLEVVGTTKISGVLTLSSTISNGTNTYTLPSATGTIALTSNLSSYVPYTGATTNVDLGGNSLYLNNSQAVFGRNFAGTTAYALIGVNPSNKVQIDTSALGVVFGGTIGNGTYTYTLPSATGTLALTSDISYPVTSVFGRTGVVIATSGDYTTTQVTEGTNLYYTDVRARASNSFVAGSGAYNSTTGVITIPTNNTQITNGSNYITLTSLSSSATGLTYTNTTGAFSLTAGYVIPTTSSATNWDSAYTNRITSATSPLSIAANVISIAQATTSTSGYLSSTDWNTFNGKESVLTFSSPLVRTTNTISIPAATTSVNGYLTSTDWTTFNNKQNALTNPVTGTGTSGRVALWSGTTTQTSSAGLTYDSTNAVLTSGTYYSYNNVGAAYNLSSNGDNVGKIQNVTTTSWALAYGTSSSIFPLGTAALTWDTTGKITFAGTLSNGTYTYTLPSATGTLPVGTGTSGYVTYFSGTNTIAGAVNHFWDNTNSRLGINTNAPLSPLQVVIGAGSGTVARFGEASGTTGKQFLIGVDTTTGRTELQSVHQGTSATPLALNPSSGSVLIGTTTDAGYKLDVSGTGRYFVNSNSVVDILVLHNNSATSSGVRQLYNNGYGNLAAISVSQRDNGSLADDGQMLFQVASNSVLDTKMTILNTGNVGIGTTSPGVALDVVGKIRNTTSGSGITMLESNNTSSTGYGAYIAGGNASNYALKVADYNNVTAFQVLGSGAATFSSSVTATNFTAGGAGSGGAGTLTVRNDGGIPASIANESVSGTLIRFSGNGSGVLGSISHNGTSVAYNTSSDYRLKQDLKEYNGLDLISAIKTYDYEWKSDNKRAYGVLAHELQEVLPQAVFGEKDGKEMQGVDYSKIVPILVKAIQEQQAQIELQDAKIEELKALIAAK